MVALPRLGIVILNFRDTQVTIDCLHSLAPCTFWENKEAKVVIWENTTGPEPIALLKDCVRKNRWADWVDLKASSVNLGFTGGNNRVIEEGLQSASPPDYFLLLNSDTLVTEKSIRTLIDFMDAYPDAGVCGSQLLSETGEIQASPFRFPSIASEFDNGLRLGLVSKLLSRWNVVMPTPSEPCKVDWLSGASMMLRRQMLEQIGLLDEGFFTYFEDADLCKRAHENGWGVWYVPESQVIHFEGASSGIVRRIIKRRPTYWFQARRRFYLKHYGAFQTAVIDAAYIIGFALWRIRRRIQNKPDTDPPNMLYDFTCNSVFLKGFQIPYVQLGLAMQQAENKKKPHHFDIMYVEGPGDLVESFRRWKSQEDVLTETSRTFSGQIFDFCKTSNLNTYAISYHHELKHLATEQFYVRNIPKLNLGGGMLYHLSQILYGLQLLAIALRYRPQYLSVTSGVTYWFVLSPLKFFGIQIVPQLHNSLWPKGYYPKGLVQRILLTLDGWFFRHIAALALCVSPEIQRQVQEIAGTACCPIYQFRAQFNEDDFKHPPLSLPHNKKPFNIVFAGRIERNKGVFDLLDMAEQLRNDGVTFEICGGGPFLEELKQACQQRELSNIVKIHGNLIRPKLLAVYARAHAVIVPTRSDFCEGLPMVVAEAILLGRPVITTRLSNALDVLGDAIVEAQPDDVMSYVQAIRNLLSDSAYYESLCKSCPPLREIFLNGEQGLTAVLYNNL